MNRTLILLILMFSSTISKGQELVFGDSTVVENIKSKTSEIYENKDRTSFFLTKKRLRKIKTSGIEITAHSKNDTIRRIVAISMTKNGQLGTEWYYWNNELIYVYESFEYFKEQEKKCKWKNFKNLCAWESRYYFVHEKLEYQKHKGKLSSIRDSKINELIKDGNNIRNYAIEHK